MLPATGLFRTINCPFFEKDLCTRPFCHFRHSKPEAPAPAAATYSATPKSLLNQNNVPVPATDGPARKKPKLEYIPMPTILAPKYVPSSKQPVAPSKDSEMEKASPEEATQVPEVDENKQSNGHNEKSVAEEAVKDSIKVDETAVKSVESEAKESEELQPKRIAVEPEKKESKKESEQKEKSSSSRSSSTSSKHRTNSKDEPESRKDKKESERKGSSSSSSDRKHSSSSSRKDEKGKSSAEKDKIREKERSSSSKPKESSKDKEHKSSSKEKDRKVDKAKSSSSSEKDKSRSSSSSTSKTDKEKSSSSSSSKSSEKDRQRSSSSSSKSKSSSSSSSKHSTSSSSSKSKSSSSVPSKPEPKPKMELAEEIYRELLDNPPSDIDVDSDEDEVMKQCKMIFEEYDTETTPAATPTAVEPTSKVKKKSEASAAAKKENSDVELIDMFADKYYDEHRKKRVAHENVTNSKPAASGVPAPVKKTNHVQNAMRSVYLRQEIVRKQQEELAAKQRMEEEAKKRIEEETRKAMSKPVTPRLSNGSPRSPVLSPTAIVTPPPSDKSPVSPISTSSFYSKPTDTMTTPRSRFSPAANVLAFQKAKEKIDNLRKMKGLPSMAAAAASTPAQTAPKGTGRMAHVSTKVAATAAAPQKPAPPVLEPESTKISYNIRMQFYNLMIKHCLNIYPSCEDAWDRAQTEELAVFKKCSTPMIYKSSALLSINKLRKEAVETGSEAAEKNKTISHDVILAGKMAQNISWSVSKKLKTEVKSTYTIDNAPSTVAYKMIFDCILTEEQLRSNGFPRGTDTPGKAKIYTPKPSRPPNEEERYCSRCSKVFNLETYEETAVDSCNYHAKSTCYRRGFADNLHSCCQQPAGTPGCMYANYHVSSFIDYDDLTGFVKTIDPPEGYVCSKKDVFALDCEMCYTTGGLELTRVTVVDINEKTVYDTLVKPTNRIVDYNTRFSGITEQMLNDTTTTLYNVQAVLLSMFNSETILIGHSLESDFKALKLIHDVVVDTSVLYPHKMGPPKKRALKTLCIENLKKIIQENDAGHDSAEDSVVCIQLIKHYLRNRIL